MTTTPQSEALRAALAARRRSEATDYPGTTDATPTAPQLEALARTLETWRDHGLITAAQAPEQANVNYPRLDALRDAVAVIRDAARYGYPRPALEQLGAQAAHLPAARSTDPHTARESGETTRSTPNARNHLGRLLRAYRIREVGAMPDDPALTSEEAARRAGLLGSEYAKRASDLLALGYLRVAQDDDGHDRTRQGASGRQRLVFELTVDGRRLADEILAD